MNGFAIFFLFASYFSSSALGALSMQHTEVTRRTEARLARGNPSLSSRRNMLLAISTFSVLHAPGPNEAVNAVQPKNEALCDTGFFTNIWQYKCTDLGDISDEGIARDLSKTQQATLDSLMSKLDLAAENRVVPAVDEEISLQTQIQSKDSGREEER